MSVTSRRCKINNSNKSNKNSNNTNSNNNSNSNSNSNNNSSNNSNNITSAFQAAWMVAVAPAKPHQASFFWGRGAVFFWGGELRLDVPALFKANHSNVRFSPASGLVDVDT